VAFALLAQWIGRISSCDRPGGETTRWSAIARP
jgi:hypothetical protein